MNLQAVAGFTKMLADLTALNLNFYLRKRKELVFENVTII